MLFLMAAPHVLLLFAGEPLLHQCCIISKAEAYGLGTLVFLLSCSFGALRFKFYSHCREATLRETKIIWKY